jgi:4-hydroxybenzoate polyprenyltransferase
MIAKIMKIVLTLDDILALIYLVGVVIFCLWVFISIKIINRKNKKKESKKNG